MSWPDHRLDEPERFQNAVELDGVDIIGIVEMDVDISGDEHWAAVDEEQLEHGCKLVKELRSDRSGSVDGQRHEVWSRELEHGQYEFKSARNEVNWNSFRTDAIPED